MTVYLNLKLAQLKLSFNLKGCFFDNYITSDKKYYVNFYLEQGIMRADIL